MVLRLRTTREGRLLSPLATAAALAALVTVTAGCSNSGGNLKAVVTTSAPGKGTATTGKAKVAAPSTVAGTPTTAAAATVAPAGPAAPDAAGILATSVSALRAGYQVDSAVAAGDQIVTQLSGRVVGAGSLFSVTSGTATVEYLQVPPQVWVREPGGDWKAADTEAVPKEALTPLSAPASLAFMGADADGQHLHASYDGASLGMAENPTVEADLVVGPDNAITVKYSAVAQGRALDVLTRLAPADPTPIDPPA